MNCNYPVNALEIEEEILDDFKNEIRTMLEEFKDDIRKMLEESKENTEINLEAK